MTPVSAISSRPVSRSSTISAPCPSADSAAAALAIAAAVCSMRRCAVGATSQPERPHAADALEAPPQLGLEHDDEREQADDRARLEELREQAQVEELRQRVDARAGSTRR